MGNMRFGGAPPAGVKLGSATVPRMYRGAELIWDAAQAPVEVPKIDTTHQLANRATMKRLTLGALEGMTADANYATADSAFASSTAGSVAFVKESLPASSVATPPATLRVSALIKVDKTAGRYSRVGFAANSTNPTTSSPDIYVGHTAGSGITVNSHNFAISTSHEVIPEAKLVDGAWYRVSLVFDRVFHQNTVNGNAGIARVQGTAEPVNPANAPAAPWHVPAFNSRTEYPFYTPKALVARTNSALGTVRDLAYVDSMLGLNGDNAPVTYTAVESDFATSSDDRMWLWGKAKAAPLRVIITSGGSGVYGGQDWATGIGRGGPPYDQWRQTWRDLADLGYTVLHTYALHEGWGADDHLTKQVVSLNRLKAQFGADVRLYYLAYSMGGLSAWRAVRGRAGFPQIRAAYILGGATGLDRYYDQPTYPQIKTRWPNRAALDEPANFSGADLIATGTRVRSVTSLGDTVMPKAANHDVMKAKYGGSPLFSELVLGSGVGHFDAAYWDAADMAAFFEEQDLS